jgi:hypothetical protein
MKNEMPYRIRREVLDMTIEEWGKLDKLNKSEVINISPEWFLDHVGLPGGASAKFDEEERKFFDEIYSLWRERENSTQS